MRFDALEHARRTLQSARLLLENGDAASAASRAYYAAFYVVRAVLAREGSEPKTHAGALREFGRLFVRTERLPPESADVFGRAMQYREMADYILGPDVDSEEVDRLVRDIAGLLDALASLLESDE